MGGKRGTIPWASNHCGRRREVQTMSQVLSSKVNLLQKELQLKREGANLFIAPVPSNLVMPLLPPIGRWVA